MSGEKNWNQTTWSGWKNKICSSLAEYDMDGDRRMEDGQMDGVMEDYEDVALEGSDGVVLANFVKAWTAIEEELPEIGTARVSNTLLNPPKDGEPYFSKDLAATLNLDFDSVEVVSGHPNTRDGKATQRVHTQRVHNEQQFKTQATKALVAQVKQTAEGDANVRILANTLDRVLVHNNFMSQTAKTQAQSNVIFAELLHEQKNGMKTMADSVISLATGLVSRIEDLNGRMEQGQTLMDGRITEVHDQIDIINNNITTFA
jgi:hypothetical protein